jgi:hypothetical protein
MRDIPLFAQTEISWSVQGGLAVHLRDVAIPFFSSRLVEIEEQRRYQR